MCSTTVAAANMSILSDWSGMLSSCKRKWWLLNVWRCEKLLWSSEEMEQINDRVIRWMLLNTYWFEEMPALKIIRLRLWVCIIYAVTGLMLSLGATFEDCWRWDTGNPGLTQYSCSCTVMSNVSGSCSKSPWWFSHLENYWRKRSKLNNFG